MPRRGEGLDESHDRAMPDLPADYVGYQNAVFASGNEVPDTYQQTVVPVLTCSSLSERRQNFVGTPSYWTASGRYWSAHSRLQAVAPT